MGDRKEEASELNAGSHSSNLVCS